MDYWACVVVFSLLEERYYIVMALTRGFKQNEAGVGPMFGGRESLYFFLVEVKIASCASLKGQMTPSLTFTGIPVPKDSGTKVIPQRQ